MVLAVVNGRLSLQTFAFDVFFFHVFHVLNMVYHNSWPVASTVTAQQFCSPNFDAKI